MQSVDFLGATDGSTFNELAGKTGPVGAYFKALFTSLGEGQVGALRCSAKRALYTHLYRESDGAEIGTSTAPIRTDPTNTTATTVQDGGSSITVDAPVATPVFVRLSDGSSAITALPITDNSGSITIDGAVSQTGGPWTMDVTKIAGSNISTAASGIAKVGIVDGSGAVWSATNPIPVAADNISRTRVTNSNTLAAAETGIAIWTPTGSTKFCVTSFTVTATVGGVLTVYDGTNSATNWLFKGTLQVGVTRLEFAHPWLSAAVNNVLRYTTGTGVTAELQVHGFEVS